MLGQIFTYFIYIRNLQLQGVWQNSPLLLRYLLLLAPAGIIIYYFNNNVIDIELLFQNKEIPISLLALGIIAQVIFTLRFVYQWLYSEKQKQSSLPLGFWLLSFIGATLILSYAIIRKDPVLFIGHLFGLVIYSRNLYLLKKQ
jgi:lipid-A-disaccharide synthase-like uncharacterized protein